MKAAKLFLTIFIVTISLAAKAQDKYEYASIVYTAYSATKGYLFVSSENKYEKTEVKISEGAIAENLTPVIELVNKMNKDGWDVYNNNTFAAPGAGVHIYYFLRKKI